MLYQIINKRQLQDIINFFNKKWEWTNTKKFKEEKYIDVVNFIKENIKASTILHWWTKCKKMLLKMKCTEHLRCKICDTETIIIPKFLSKFNQNNSSNKSKKSKNSKKIFLDIMEYIRKWFPQCKECKCLINTWKVEHSCN